MFHIQGYLVLAMADFVYYITNIGMDCIHNTIVLNTITWCRMYSFTISILSRIHPVMQIHSVITWWRMQFYVITGPVGSASLSLGKLVSWWRRSLIFQPMLLYFDETLVIKVASIINCKLAIYNCICMYISLSNRKESVYLTWSLDLMFPNKCLFKLSSFWRSI